MGLDWGAEMMAYLDWGAEMMANLKIKQVSLVMIFQESMIVSILLILHMLMATTNPFRL